jgi:hypothetical protein
MFIVSNFNQNEKSLRNESLNNVSQMSDRYAHPTKYDDFLKPAAMELLTCIPTTPKNTHSSRQYLYISPIQLMSIRRFINNYNAKSMTKFFSMT